MTEQEKFEADVKAELDKLERAARRLTDSQSEMNALRETLRDGFNLLEEQENDIGYWQHELTMHERGIVECLERIEELRARDVKDVTDPPF